MNQAFNSFALESYTDTTTATARAYSLGQQLINDAVQRRLRDPAHLRRLRLAGRLAARPRLVRGREGQEGRARCWALAFSSWIWPVLGILLLPWTTLAYVLMWSAVGGVDGWEWLVVALGFAIDIAAHGSRTAKSRYQSA